MNRFSLKLTTSAVSAVLGLASLAPAAFGATTLSVTGNGSNSTNSVNVSSSNANFVTQSNAADVVNNVSVSSSTGGNQADSNTGGNSSISTGPASAKVDLSTQANSNIANVTACNCLGNTDVNISDNGHQSSNSVDLDQSNTNKVDQTNLARVSNYVDANASTGHNSASSNTDGDNSIHTGGANSDVSVTNAVNSNVVTLGGQGGGNLSVSLSGNGEDSTNEADLDLSSANFVSQANDALVANFVSSNAKTGDNHADSNTGGNTDVSTGSAHDTVKVSNMANFNGADLPSCDCVTGLDATISGNGHQSSNSIDFSSDDNANVLGQVNLFDGLNHVFGDGKTGHNSASSNTDGANFVSTGGSDNNTTVSTDANSNVLGSSSLGSSNNLWSMFLAWAHMSS